MIQLGAMPLPSFLKLHPDDRVTAEELATLKAYLAPWTAAPSQPGNVPTAVAPGASAPVSLASASLTTVQPELNGFAFDPSFENWKPISTADRGDNNTFRFILGNDVAVKAAQSGNISPWPDGARFAKIAWQQELGTDGLPHPGKFVQVELMLKNSALYKETEGWGWGRWRGMELKPYGQDAHFVNECTGCHRPLRGNDHVYTLPISTAKVSREEVVNNDAALPASLPYQPLSWNAITMYVDPNTRAMATLYGNDAAMQAVQARRSGGRDAGIGPEYEASAVLALVTWVQRDDPHWFGARIPYTPRSVEFVQVSTGGQSSYQRFAGTGLAEDPNEAAVGSQRTSFMLNLVPAWLP
ncbi:MAG: cytochrome P460 family protein [Candidatus Sulfotelmatobacter sp.]